jgi:hypothetical protein
VAEAFVDDRDDLHARFSHAGFPRTTTTWPR